MYGTLSGPRIEMAFYLQLITFAIDRKVYVICQVFSHCGEAAFVLGATLKIHIDVGWHI